MESTQHDMECRQQVQRHAAYGDVTSKASSAAFKLTWIWREHAWRPLHAVADSSHTSGPAETESEQTYSEVYKAAHAKQPQQHSSKLLGP